MKMSYCVYTFLTMMLAVFSCGCVHEFPSEIAEGKPVTVSLVMTPDKTWETQDFDPASRADDSDVWRSRYILKVYEKGSRKNPAEENVYYGDIDEESFIADLTLQPGEWDIYVWRDNCHPELTFHDTERFEAISYLDSEYHGAHEMREAFEGMVTIRTSDMTEDGKTVIYMDLTRPVAKYMFIATDYREFCEVNKDSFDRYRTEGVYPLFMPSVYNMFTKQIVDSDTGRSYLCDITPMNEDEAVIAFDHVFMNDRDNAAQIQLLLHDPSGGVRSVTTTLTVPLRRGITTYVRGDFLTVKGGGGGGIKIDTSFSGEFNIQL